MIDLDKDLDLIFNTSDFGEKAIFNGIEGVVFFEIPSIYHSEPVNGLTVSNFHITLKASTFPTLKNGDLITLRGSQYKVMNIQYQGDGKVKSSPVSKVMI